MSYSAQGFGVASKQWRQSNLAYSAALRRGGCPTVGLTAGRAACWPAAGDGAIAFFFPLRLIPTIERGIIGADLLTFLLTFPLKGVYHNPSGLSSQYHPHSLLRLETCFPEPPFLSVSGQFAKESHLWKIWRGSHSCWEALQCSSVRNSWAGSSYAGLVAEYNIFFFF